MVMRVRLRFVFLIVCLVAFVVFSVEFGVQCLRNVWSYDSPLRVMIIDAGHGGADGGAVGKNGVIESDINLAIALKLDTLAHLYGITTIMTRSSADIQYPESADSIAKMKLADQSARVSLIRDYPHGILISIHQNYYPTESPSGVQVFHGHNQTSAELANIMQTQLTKALCPQNTRLAAEISDDIYLMREIDNTAVLVECGFISNPPESELLQTDVYQRKIAATVLGSYIIYTSEIGNER